MNPYSQDRKQQRKAIENAVGFFDYYIIIEDNLV